ncbi:VCBS repeat-containing protein [Flagellimonas pacifica]|uniref:FG-GAP repeat-containing protein n=1 Tax=Flagellimonas pacifica TaxID=1247520 RepID=A0A285ME94_9FLAO|nr:VCBS repeat-containing protein [Allomuricauda parva]SNY95459.1 FG-GAP repeat-containing protein [Allomuricauda parva]
MKKEPTIKALLLLTTTFVLFSSCNTKKNDTSFLFTDLDSDHTNIHFVNANVENELTNSFLYEYVYNGAGVAVGDINNDGLEDIYFTSNLGKNALYLNQGDLEFKDISIPSKTTGNRGWATGVNMVDINNDGLLDIYVCKSGPYERKDLLHNELFINKGVNTKGIPVFEESAAKFGLNDTGHSIQSAFIDYDLDGDLDMYLMNHNPQTFSLGNTETFSPLGDRFYENQNGKYVNITKKTGIHSNSISYGLGVGISDLNDDGWPDIYISNDYDEPDYLYLNQKNGTFKEVIKKATNHISNFSMGNDIADFDNDGFVDILTLDMVSEDNYGMKTSMASMNPQKFNNNVAAGKHHQYMYNTLQKNSGHIDSSGIPFFSDIAQMSGISNTDWSWAPLFADFDNDGLKDIFISNGIKRDFRNKDFYGKLQSYLKENHDALSNPEKIKFLINSTPHRPYTNYFYRNTGGLSFENTSKIWQKEPKSTYSNGAAYADLDNDGDLDMVVNNVDEKAIILRNNSELRETNYLKIEFKDQPQNSMGIGVRVKVYSDGKEQVYENYSVRGYQSSVPPKIVVGLGTQKIVDSITVSWPGQKIQHIFNPNINTTLTVSYTSEKEQNNHQQVFPSKLFESIPLGAEITHTENDFDDYKLQVLLPHKMSGFGPAIAVGDINGDKRDDFFIGQSTGTPSSIYVQKANGAFQLLQSFEKEVIYEDVDAEFFDYDNDGDQDLIVATGGNEFKPGSANYRDRLYENKNGTFVKRMDLLPNISVSSSKIRIADFDNDGHLDVFVGGRFLPNNYPSPASSYLLKNVNGKFVDVTKTVIPELQDIGLVTDATWADYDQDGDLDLSIVGEWMKPTFFNNLDGSFSKVSTPSLEALSGWYFSIKPIDIDNDGDEDYILGNLGQNYKYKATKDEPFEVYYHDFDDNGKKDIVLGYYNFGELYPVRGRECSSQQMPSVKKIAPTYDVFGKSTVSDIYGHKNLADALHLSAYNFKSGILKNNNNGNFEFIEFPEIAQISSVNTILSWDINKDGLNDLVLAGNLFASEIETPRNDAGYGLVLMNKGKGIFEPVNANRSGLFLPKDVKNLNFIEIGSEPHLLVGKNNEPLDLLKILTTPSL